MQDLVVANEFNSSIFSLCIPSNAFYGFKSCYNSHMYFTTECIDPKHTNPSLEMNLHKELFPFAQNFQSLIQYIPLCLYLMNNHLKYHNFHPDVPEETLDITFFS